jgi:hypothetical protein
MKVTEVTKIAYNEYVSLRAPLDNMVEGLIASLVHRNQDKFDRPPEELIDTIFDAVVDIIYSESTPKAIVEAYDFYNDEVRILIKVLEDYLSTAGDFSDILYDLVSREMVGESEEHILSVCRTVQQSLAKLLEEVLEQF